jgi:hypothetical protein
MKTGVILLAVVFCTAASSDEFVFFETDFDSLPDGWTNTNWTFGSGGASCYHHSFGLESWEADMHTIGYLYQVPVGSDSIRLTLQHAVALTAGSGCAEAKVFMNGGMVWGEELSWGSYYSSEDIDFVVVNPGGGSLVSLEIKGKAEGWDMEYGDATVNWHISLLRLTAYGDLALRGSTWGSIKSVF